MTATYLLVCLLLTLNISTQAQNKKTTYNSCLLRDSVEKRLEFIKLSAIKIFNDSADCKQTLLDSIGSKYMRTKDSRYLDALAVIRQTPGAKVSNLYTDLVKRLAENDFQEFINRLYDAKGRYLSLEKELIGAMNMIVNERPLKLKYYGLLNVEIDKAKDANDKLREAYFKKLKLRIANETYK
jgi:hypothetical protein